MSHSTIVTITSDTTDRFQTGEVDSKHMRSFLIKCITNTYARRGIINKPTQAEISKNLRKIKNNEVDEYFSHGYILIKVSKDGKESNYAYCG